MSDLHSSARFSDRVDDYVRYRPDYPLALLDWLQREQGVDVGLRVADVGAGTGILSKMFFDAGFRVTAVEPNAPMRAAAERWLQAYEHFDAVDGNADATGLPEISVDLVIVAQAFHWFDEASTRREFARILCPHGLAAIWWNLRQLTGTRFLKGCEALLQTLGTDYPSVAERYADDARKRDWFDIGFRGNACFRHLRRLDFETLRGRLISSSCAPKAGHPRHKPTLHALRERFKHRVEHGTVSFDDDTRIFAGQLA